MSCATASAQNVCRDPRAALTSVKEGRPTVCDPTAPKARRVLPSWRQLPVYKPHAPLKPATCFEETASVKLFQCACAQVIHFENTKCEKCNRGLGYLPEQNALRALEPVASVDANGRDSLRPEWQIDLPHAAVGPRSTDLWHVHQEPGRRYRFCINAEIQACNWLILEDEPERFCKACRHNRNIPDLTWPDNLRRWRLLEVAKHRLFYTLLRLHLPLITRDKDPEHGLAFDFLAIPLEGQGTKVMTGHDNGLITIALSEADDSEREHMRLAMGENYRTLLGHFRHEVGHWFWDLLVRDGAPGHLEVFRALFGDERVDYSEALKKHYYEGPPEHWAEEFITPYASSHAWEDWAETWAHYLHIVDTLETAYAFGLHVRPRIAPDAALTADPATDPYTSVAEVQSLIDDWLPLTFALNGLNRSMGQPDLYPFIISPKVIEKLDFVHKVVHCQLHRLRCVPVARNIAA